MVTRSISDDARYLFIKSTTALSKGKISSSHDANACEPLMHLRTLSNTWSEEVCAMNDDAMHLLALATL